MKLKIKRVHPEAKLPAYAHRGDAGFDLFACVDHDLVPGEVKAISIGSSSTEAHNAAYPAGTSPWLAASAKAFLAVG